MSDDTDRREIRFAARDEIERRADALDAFVSGVLELPWAMVTDGSSLRDFDGLDDDGVPRRAERLYGLALESRHYEMPLWQLLDELEAAKRRRNVN